MRILRLILLVCGLTAPGMLWGAPVVLAKLEYKPGILLPERADVKLIEGTQPSRYAGKPRALWTLHAGDSLRSPTPPAERTIRFYRVNGNEVETVCTVLVKYVADGGAWRPVFHLLQTPMVTFDGKRLVPVGTQDSARGLIQAHGLQRPDREGFYRELIFGYATGETTIDAWEVQ
jgi:hypothetical protein